MRAQSQTSEITQKSSCTIFWHVPVDELHSIENKDDTGARFSLTVKTRSVKPQSFFDNFLSLPGWC
jgi:hypothetical protein